MNVRTLAVALTLIATTLGASAAANPDQLPSLRYLVGTWTCTYHAGTTTGSYKALYTYDMGSNWLVERDTWAGGGDEGRFTYDAKRQRWVVVVAGNDRSTTVFEGSGSADHRAYRTIYPNADANETIDRVSPQKYTVHFTQTTSGQTTTSNDVCVKQ